MKRLIPILIMLFLSLGSISTAQIQQKKTFFKSQTETYIDWKLSNDGCYGCASFYWLVNRTFIPNKNTYKFEIWFYSNSYYANGVWASTYLQGLYFNVDGFNLYDEPAWMLFKDKYTSALSTFYTTNPTPIVKMSWSSMKVY